MVEYYYIMSLYWVFCMVDLPNIQLNSSNISSVNHDFNSKTISTGNDAKVVTLLGHDFQVQDDKHLNEKSPSKSFQEKTNQRLDSAKNVVTRLRGWGGEKLDQVRDFGSEHISGRFEKKFGNFKPETRSYEVSEFDTPTVKKSFFDRKTDFVQRKMDSFHREVDRVGVNITSFKESAVSLFSQAKASVQETGRQVISSIQNILPQGKQKVDPPVVSNHASERVLEKFSEGTAQQLKEKGFSTLALVQTNKANEHKKVVKQDNPHSEGAAATQTDGNKWHGGIQSIADAMKVKVSDDLNGLQPGKGQINIADYAKSLSKFDTILYTAGGLDQFVDDVRQSLGVRTHEEEWKSKVSDFLDNFKSELIFLDKAKKPTREELEDAFNSKEAPNKDIGTGLPDLTRQFGGFESYKGIFKLQESERFDAAYNKTVELLEGGADQIQETLGKNEKILVSCNKGQNRSSATNIMHEMKYNGKSFEEAYDHVIGKRLNDSPCKVKGYLFACLKCYDIKRGPEGELGVGKYLIEHLMTNQDTEEFFESKLKALCANPEQKETLQAHYQEMKQKYKENGDYLKSVSFGNNAKSEESLYSAFDKAEKTFEGIFQ